MKLMGEVYAELWVAIKKEHGMNEDDIMVKWRQLIEFFRTQGHDVSDDTQSFWNSIGEGKPPTDEIWLGVGAGKTTGKPDYHGMYQVLGKLIQFLYEEVVHSGELSLKLHRTGASG